MDNTSKIIEILDPQAGKLKETVKTEAEQPPPSEIKSLFESRNGRTISLSEASTLSDFPVLLRDGIRSITYDYYAQQPTTYQQWCMVVPSEKPQEDWVEENAIGELPVVSEQDPYPEFKQDLDEQNDPRDCDDGLAHHKTPASCSRFFAT